MNVLLLVAFVLDPRHKIKFAHWFTEQSFDAPGANELKQKLELCLKEIFEEFSGELGGPKVTFNQLSLLDKTRTPTIISINFCFQPVPEPVPLNLS